VPSEKSDGVSDTNAVEICNYLNQRKAGSRSLTLFLLTKLKLMKVFVIIMLSLGIVDSLFSMLRYVGEEEGVKSIGAFLSCVCFILALVFFCNIAY
jgi:hypothetical protein